MEYTICQRERKNPLILSEYCGIANSMKDAIRINPWDLGDCARAIDQCLCMSEGEKSIRHEVRDISQVASSGEIRFLSSIYLDRVSSSESPLTQRVFGQQTSP